MEVIDVSLDLINLSNPLLDRDMSDIESSKEFLDLMFSIKTVGLLSPISVTESSEAGKYDIHIGKRRFLAFFMLNSSGEIGFEKIPCIVKSRLDSDYPLELEIIHENKFRHDISASARIESLLRLLPLFINKDSSPSLESGVLYARDYFFILKGETVLEPEQISSFIGSMERFLHLSKISQNELLRYLSVSELSDAAKNFFMEGTLFLKDALILDEIKNISEDDYNRCCLAISADFSRKANALTVAEFAKKMKKSKIDTGVFIKNTIRRLTRVSKGLVVSREASDEIQSLFAQVEVILKKEKNKK